MAFQKRLGALATILVVIFVALYARQHGLLQPDAVIRFHAAHPVSAFASFLLIYALAAFVAVPTLPLNLASGVLWGPWWGGVISTAGSTVGAIAALYSARLLFGRLLARQFNSSVVTWLQGEFEEKGWRSIAFLRLNPVFPTGVLNYMIGLTAIDVKTYAWATFFFLLPPSFAVALIGHELGTFAMTGDARRWVQRLILVSAAVVILVALRYTARYLDRAR